MNQELPDVQARFRKGRGTRDKNCQHVLDHQESKRIQENISTSISLTKILKEMGVPDHLTYILRNLYVGQEATVRTGHGTTDQFQIGKRVHQGCILSLCLSNLYAEFIMRNMPSWMNHKLKLRLPGEISTTSNMQMIPLSIA